MQVQCTLDIESLTRLCRLANREAFRLFEARATCIITSAALCDALHALGVDAELMRVEAVAFGGEVAAILGGDGDGTRRRAAAPGMWRGHLTVVAGRRFLLDPTLDQVDGNEPFVGEVTDEWLRGERTLWWGDGGRTAGHPALVADSAIRYHAYPGRGGWKSAPDFRVTRRRELVAAIRSAWGG